ncbi:MAG: response regulator [Gammaproteobacteria bacterium]|nr:response regulator [Gammaproteobacteria bacterium]
MKNWGIKTRVLFLALLPALLVSTLLAGYLIFTQLRDLDDTLTERGFSIVRHLGPASEYGVFSGSSEILKPLVTSVINEPDVRSVTISDSYGVILASAGEPGYSKSIFKSHDPKVASVNSDNFNSLVFRAPILRSEFVIDPQLQEEMQVLEQVSGSNQSESNRLFIGWVTLEFDKSRTIERRNELIASSILLTLFVLFGGVILAVRLGRDVSHPIVELTDTVRQVESGILDKPITVKTGGELGRLASGMNAMMTALKAAHEDLQQRVDQATEQYKDALSMLERKNVELEKARKQAEAASDAKSEFLANVSHEIRNPLNGVLGFLKLLSKTELNSEQNRYLRTIDVSAKNLLRIISDLLDLSRIEAGKMSLDYRVFSVNQMLSDIIALHIPAAAEKNLELNSEVDEQLPQFEEGDPVRIGQVLSNLIGNAIKFTDQGQITVACVVRQNVKRRLVLEFSVSDTGLGIEPEDQSLVYESFYQVDSSTRRNFGGAGLGLSIARKLIEMMGGQINLESVPGKGTKVSFTVVLTAPLIQVKDTGENNELPSVTNKLVKFEGELRVLVVDDNEINRNLCSILMTAYGICVDEAENAHLALEKVKHNNYDLILMDVHMPKMDGMEATRKIRSWGDAKGNIPIVALTADIVADRRNHFLEVGMNDYLAKPVEEHALLSIFLKWCPDKAKPGSLIKKGVLDTVTESSGDASLILDSVLGLRYASGKDSVWKKSLSLLLEKLHGELGELQRLADNGDRAGLSEIAHGIKGSANYCGAVALGKTAAELESDVQNAVANRITFLVQEMIGAAEALKEHISEHYPDVNSNLNSGVTENE